MPAFTHRQRVDGTWDSICMKCHLTVVAQAKVHTEEELDVTDEQHICNFSRRDSDKEAERKGWLN